MGVPRSSDVAVIGGGPAGCVAAVRLAEIGHAVVLISRPRGRGAAPFEGFSERVLDGLRFVGCEDALRTAGPRVRRFASWGGRTAAANQEYLVDRDAFDGALRADAAARGVAVVEGRVERAEQHQDRWRLRVRRGDDGGVLEIAAAFLVEARGRAAPGPYRRRGPATTALVQPWSRPSAARGGARTAVAGFEQGWAWFAAAADGRAAVQIAVSSEVSRLPKREGLAEFFAALLGRIAEAREWLADGRPAGPVSARHAGFALAATPVGKRFVRVGDAAAAIDPLSGHGAFEAVGSALAAAAVVNTLLDRPRDAALAESFYAERVEDAFARHSRIGRDFYALEQRWPEARFWAERRRWPDDLPAHRAPSGVAASAVARRPVIEDGYVVEREAVVTPDHPRGVWQVAGVPLVPLLRLAKARRTDGGDSLTEAAARLDRPPAQVLTALAWLRYRGLLA